MNITELSIGFALVAIMTIGFIAVETDSKTIVCTHETTVVDIVEAFDRGSIVLLDNGKHIRMGAAVRGQSLCTTTSAQRQWFWQTSPTLLWENKENVRYLPDTYLPPAMFPG